MKSIVCFILFNLTPWFDRDVLGRYINTALSKYWKYVKSFGRIRWKGPNSKKWKCYASTPLSLASSTTFSGNFNTVLEINLQWYKEMHFYFIIFHRFWEYHFTYPSICIFSDADAIPLKSNALNVSFYERIHTINLLLNFVMF